MGNLAGEAEGTIAGDRTGRRECRDGHRRALEQSIDADDAAGDLFA